MNDQFRFPFLFKGNPESERPPVSCRRLIQRLQGDLLALHTQRHLRPGLRCPDNVKISRAGFRRQFHIQRDFTHRLLNVLQENHFLQPAAKLGQVTVGKPAPRILPVQYHNLSVMDGQVPQAASHRLTVIRLRVMDVQPVPVPHILPFRILCPVTAALPERIGFHIRPDAAPVTGLCTADIKHLLRDFLLPDLHRQALRKIRIVRAAEHMRVPHIQCQCLRIHAFLPDHGCIHPAQFR